MLKTSKQHEIKLPTRKQDAAILVAAKSDPDAQPLTAVKLAAMVPMRSLRGRPKLASRKVLLSVRYSPEVVAYFKSTGDGSQARVDGVLRNYVSRGSRSAKVGSK